jgi:hypothetical protein
LSGEIDERSKNRQSEKAQTSLEESAKTKTSLEESANLNGGSLENDEDKTKAGDCTL